MKLDELSVEELTQKIEELKTKEKNCEFQIGSQFLEKIRLVTQEMSDLRDNAVFRKPKNAMERWKLRRSKYSYDKYFLLEKEFPFNGSWYYGTKHANRIDVGYCLEVRYAPGHSYSSKDIVNGIRERFGIIWDDNLVLSIERSTRYHEKNETPPEPVVSLSHFAKEETEWIPALDELYLIAFEKQRQQKVYEAKRLTDRIEKLCPHIKVDSIED